MDKKDATRQLFKATKAGSFADAQVAIDAGADVNAKDEFRDTPLHWAARHNNLGLANLLIEKGADLHAINRERWTPEYFANYFGLTDIAELLETAAKMQQAHAARVTEERKDKGPPQVGG